MVKKFKWTPTKILITILLIIGLVVLIYYGIGEKKVCCKITMVLGPEYQPVTPSYTWQEKDYCSNMINGEPITGASRIIVSDSFCDDLSVGNNLLSVSTGPKSSSGFGGGGLG